MASRHNYGRIADRERIEEEEDGEIGARGRYLDRVSDASDEGDEQRERPARNVVASG